MCKCDLKCVDMSYWSLTFSGQACRNTGKEMAHLLHQKWSFQHGGCQPEQCWVYRQSDQRCLGHSRTICSLIWLSLVPANFRIDRYIGQPSSLDFIIDQIRKNNKFENKSIEEWFCSTHEFNCDHCFFLNTNMLDLLDSMHVLALAALRSLESLWI